ncbi:MAG: ABC transporter permease [Gemmatimonadetes bacterium]|nr:MAG: ABC transporter permease [Gemmatimonadota bacterium]HMC55319.1 ABC transporter permease [Gemmatimonadaceae bacterium]
MPNAERRVDRMSAAMREAYRELAVVAAVVVAIGGAAALLLLAMGFPIAGGLTALWTGSFGSWYVFTSASLVRAVPLMLTGAAVALAFRGGVLNIGGEGQLLVGAAAAAAVALAMPSATVTVPLVIAAALLAAALGGALWASVAAYLRARYGVLEVISTIMLNFVALHLVSYLVRGPLQEPTHVYPQSATIVDALHLPRLPGAGRLHSGFVVALTVAVAAGWMLRRTAAGFRLVAAGENPAAATSAGGIDVRVTTARVFLLSGALAGLAGGVEVLGVTFALYENISPGYGYTAIAVALLARLDPWRVVATAVLFGALEAGAGAMQRDAGVPSTLVSVIEAALILAVVATQSFRSRRQRPDVGEHVQPVDA